MRRYFGRRVLVELSQPSACSVHGSTRAHSVRCKSSSSAQPQKQVPVSWLHKVSGVSHNGEQLTLLENYDAILVLAGGQTACGGVPPWAERRLDAGHDLQMRQADPSCRILCLGGGTPHKPPALGPRGYAIHEATSCANYLLRRGAKADTILKECSSFDTVGNAYFSLTIHAIPAGWRRLAVVTSDFHMPRTQALFIDMYTLAAQSLFNEPNRYHLTFVSVTDEGLFEHSVIEARREKEAASVASWRNKSAQMRTLSDVHAWLHSKHACYSVMQQALFDQPLVEDPRLLASY